jgi:acetyl-CoA carboxylase biotin carboxyl carrier protein
MTEETPHDANPEAIAASAEALPDLRSEAVRLANELPGTPQRMRVEAAGTAVEVDWDTSAPDTGAASPDAETSPSDPAPSDPAQSDPVGYQISAPLVGTFYRAASPGEAPFAEVGDVVTAGQQVAIVEAMKLMNAVEADRPGTVAAVLVENGEMVEYGQPLVVLDTNEGGS